MLDDQWNTFTRKELLHDRHTSVMSCTDSVSSCDVIISDSRSSSSDVKLVFTEFPVSYIGDAFCADDPLMEAGIDSISAISFTNSILKEFGVSTSASLLFDYPTIASLTTHVISLLEARE
jgi:hypothetical protein